MKKLDVIYNISFITENNFFTYELLHIIIKATKVCQYVYYNVKNLPAFIFINHNKKQGLSIS